MKIDYLDIKQIGGAKTALVSSEEEVIRIEPETFAEPTAVKVTGRHILIIMEGAGVRDIDAEDCKVITRGGCSVLSIAARELEADGNVYPLYGMTIAGDARIAGELTGERHFPYRVGGDLTAQAVDVDGHVEVGGEVRVSDYINARSLKTPQQPFCPNVNVMELEVTAAARDGDMEMAL